MPPAPLTRPRSRHSPVRYHALLAPAWGPAAGDLLVLRHHNCGTTAPDDLLWLRDTGDGYATVLGEWTLPWGSQDQALLPDGSLVQACVVECSSLFLCTFNPWTGETRELVLDEIPSFPTVRAITIVLRLGVDEEGRVIRVLWQQSRPEHAVDRVDPRTGERELLVEPGPHGFRSIAVEARPLQVVLGACLVEADNHGQYVACVAHRTKDLVRSGVLTDQERSRLVKAAARSDVGKPR